MVKYGLCSLTLKGELFCTIISDKGSPGLKVVPCLLVMLALETRVQRTALRGDVEGDDADEKLGICKASSEPFQLLQSHKARKPRNQDANGAEQFAIERTRAAIRDL